jgi:hypothetical protein
MLRVVITCCSEGHYHPFPCSKFGLQNCLSVSTGLCEVASSLRLQNQIQKESKYAQHILDCNDEYGTIENTIYVIRVARKEKIGHARKILYL